MSILYVWRRKYGLVAREEILSCLWCCSHQVVRFFIDDDARLLDFRGILRLMRVSTPEKVWDSEFTLKYLLLGLISFVLVGCAEERILICADDSHEAIYKLKYRFGSVVDYMYRSEGQWVENCSPQYSTVTNDSLICRSSGGFSPSVIDLVAMTSTGGLFSKNQKCRWR